MSKTVLLEEKTEEVKLPRGRMPLRPVSPEPTDCSENKLMGAETLHIVLKSSSGIDVITTSADRARFLFGPTWSVVAVVNTFTIVPVVGSFDERLEQFKKKQKHELLTAHVSHLFTEENFPLEKKGSDPYQVHLVKFLKRAISDEVISLLSGDKIWMRPGVSQELLDFGMNYPKVQEYHRITALGSSTKVLQKMEDGQIEVEFAPALSSGKIKTLRRMLTVVPWRTNHPIGELFLAVNKWTGARRMM